MDKDVAQRKKSQSCIKSAIVHLSQRMVIEDEKVLKFHILPKFLFTHLPFWYILVQELIPFPYRTLIA